MNSTTTFTIKAWQRMFVLRSCPPDRDFLDPQQTEQVEAHVRACPWCRKRQETMYDMQDFQQAGDVLREYLARQSSQSPSPGQIWTVSSQLGGWDEQGQYMNPPSVLVLYTFDDPAPGVRVAQVCPEQDLIGERDVLLSSGLGFAQGWNTYALAAEDLEYLIAEVPPKLVEAVLDVEDSEAVPVDENSTLHFFRTLELELGSFFALKSLAKLLPEEDEFPLTIPFPFDSTQEVRKALQQSHPDILIPVDIQNPILMAAKSRLPADELPLAAESGKTPFEIIAHALHIRTGRLELEPLRVQLQNPAQTAQGIVFGGKLEDLDEEPEALLAWWEGSAEAIVQAEESEAAGESRMFRISFTKDQAVDPDSGRLIILALVSHGF